MDPWPELGSLHRFRHAFHVCVCVGSTIVTAACLYAAQSIHAYEAGRQPKKPVHAFSLASVAAEGPSSAGFDPNLCLACLPSWARLVDATKAFTMPRL